MVECLVVTTTLLLEIAIAWIVLSILLIFFYPYKNIEERLGTMDILVYAFIVIGVCIFFVLICVAIGWFLFTYLPSIICIKIVGG